MAKYRIVKQYDKYFCERRGMFGWREYVGIPFDSAKEAHTALSEKLKCDYYRKDDISVVWEDDFPSKDKGKYSFDHS